MAISWPDGAAIRPSRTFCLTLRVRGSHPRNDRAVLEDQDAGGDERRPSGNRSATAAANAACRSSRTRTPAKSTSPASACRLFNADTCRCGDYANRLALVSDCVGLTPQNVRTISWLPRTCAYRLVAEGATSSPGIRWSRAIRKACTRPGFRCAGGSRASETDLDEPRTISTTCWTRNPERRRGRIQRQADAAWTIRFRNQSFGSMNRE